MGHPSGHPPRAVQSARTLTREPWPAHSFSALLPGDDSLTQHQIASFSPLAFCAHPASLEEFSWGRVAAAWIQFRSHCGCFCFLTAFKGCSEGDKPKPKPKNQNKQTKQKASAPGTFYALNKCQLIWLPNFKVL